MGQLSNSQVESPAPVPVIWVVDDDPSVCKSLSRLIRSAGWKVATFASASEFMKYGLFPDAASVVLDVHMPGLTGCQVHEWMTKERISLPVIVLTGHGDSPTGIQAMKRGAVDFLLKPVDDEILLEAIRHAVASHETQKFLGKHRRRSPSVR